MARAASSGTIRTVKYSPCRVRKAGPKEVVYGRKTYNARSETVDQLVTYKAAWAKGQRCIIPAEAIFEPCYETGKAVRWCIQQAGGVPMGIAGIFRPWKAPDGRWLWTMSCDRKPSSVRKSRRSRIPACGRDLPDIGLFGWAACRPIPDVRSSTTAVRGEAGARWSERYTRTRPQAAPRPAPVRTLSPRASQATRSPRHASPTPPRSRGGAGCSAGSPRAAWRRWCCG